MTTLYRAAWVLPIVSAPRRDGWVLVSAGRVIAAGEGQGPSGQFVNLGRTAILPGLVNAHTHLELSWLKGRVPPASRMPEWIAALMALRRQVHIDDPFAMAAAVAAARRSGTSVVGDVTNTLASAHAVAAGPMGAQIFYELLGFSELDPARKVEQALQLRERLDAVRSRVSIVPHAPYSVSSALLREIAGVAAREGSVISVHAGESPEEIEFLQQGTGAWKELLMQIGAWNEAWQPPHAGPVAYLDSLGLVTHRTLLVHGTQLTDAELSLAAARGATLVTCPRSNEWVGVGAPPLERFYQSGVRVAVGTDSLASCPDLNLFSELRLMRQVAPEIPAARLLRSATRDGAEALGFGDDYGSIETGRRADLIAVDVPDGTTDVEEYLCSGIEPAAVRWLA